jgi:hypothetical protein
MLRLTKNKFNPDGYWSNPIDKLTFIPTVEDIDLFDQNGYDLTEIEKYYSITNDTSIFSHRSHRSALKQSWFIQDYTNEGAHLNHSLLFERKAYNGSALDQLRYWAKDLPLLYKIISIKPKWGLDFSMDYADRDGNVFELLHWEWDSFSFEEINIVKSAAENIIINIDWKDAASTLLRRKSEWYHLDFFNQSDWKCEYFGISKERFKMVIWQ